MGNTASTENNISSNDEINQQTVSDVYNELDIDWENIPTLDALDAFIRSPGFDKALEVLWGLEGDERDAKIEELKAWEKKQKELFHPENNNVELKKLKDEAVAALDEMDGDEETRERHRKLLLQIAALRGELTEKFVRYERVTNLMQSKVAVVANRGSGRSNRAKRAGLLSKHAGRSKIVGAATDKHGNAQGDEYDLGVDGAFSPQAAWLSCCALT